MNERAIPTTNQPVRSDLRRLQDQLPLRLSRWAAMKALFVSWRAACAAESAYGTARARGASRDVAAKAAFESMVAEERPNQDAGDAERVRHVVDAGHGDSPLRVRAATEMDHELGALASHRQTASTNADTYVVVLCVLAFAGLALLGFYPVHSIRTGDGATAPTRAIACRQVTGPATPSPAVTLATTCR